MYVNFDLNSLVLLLRDNDDLMNLLPGGLTAEKPYYEQQTPYAYFDSVSLPPNGIIVRHVVKFTVVLGNDGIDKEFKRIVSVMDNALLSPIDGCLPIKKVGDVKVYEVSKGQSPQKYRYSEKGNLSLEQDYYFDVVTVE